jgi:hypothetical protein
MSEPPLPVARHEATDRIGRISLSTAHDLGAALAGSSATDGEPIVMRTGGPHRTVDGLLALIDAALADEDGGGTAGQTPHPGARDIDSQDTAPSS